MIKITKKGYIMPTKMRNKIYSNTKKKMKKANTPDSSRNINRIVPRAYTQWPTEIDLPCFEPERNWMKYPITVKPTSDGILYLKPIKVGSSTSAGVNLRIARNVANQQNKSYSICKVRVAHGPNEPGMSMFHNRSLQASILWTTLRDPTKRLISQFFHFEVSRKGIAPTDENFRDFIKKAEMRIEDYYLKALTTRKHFTDRRGNKPFEVIANILNDFNFIAITERMNESVVALMMILNLKISDILYLSAKRNGGYDDGGSSSGCVVITPSFVSRDMKKYFSSNHWKKVVKYDYMLYVAANKSLDLTIDALGREQFKYNLDRFLNAQQLALQKCQPKVVFPCDINGTFHKPNDCLFVDSGCGFECLDDVANELDLW
jgi:hypothetical protein